MIHTMANLGQEIALNERSVVACRHRSVRLVGAILHRHRRPASSVELGILASPQHYCAWMIATH